MPQDDEKWAMQARKKASTQGGDPQEWWSIVMSEPPSGRKEMFHWLMRNGPKSTHPQVKQKRKQEKVKYVIEGGFATLSPVGDGADDAADDGLLETMSQDPPMRTVSFLKE